jgi:hypothetical protein
MGNVLAVSSSSTADAVVVVAVALVLVVFPLGGLIDAASRSGDIWDMTYQNNSLWVVLQLVGLVCGIGFIPAFLYLGSTPD